MNDRTYVFVLCGVFACVLLSIVGMVLTAIGGNEIPSPLSHLAASGLSATIALLAHRSSRLSQ